VRNCGDWQILFSGGSCECDRGSNVFGFQGGEVGENVFGGVSGSEDRAECNACSFEDGLATAHVRVADDLLFIIFRISGHGMGVLWPCIICSRIDDKRRTISEMEK
jgi:hypothetical protein